MSDAPRCQLVSSVPGRLRIRDHRLNAGTLSVLAGLLGEVPGLTQLTPNPGAHSLVLHYDPDRLALPVLEDLIDTAVAASVEATQPRKPGLNRYAKMVMLGSLATSLGLAASGQRRAHALTGGLFVLCLGLHLHTHRARLLD